MIRGNTIVLILKRLLCNDPKARNIVIRSRSGSVKVKKLLTYIKRKYYPVYLSLLKLSPRQDETSLLHAMRAALRYINIYENEYNSIGDLCANIQICEKIHQVR